MATVHECPLVEREGQLAAVRAALGGDARGVVIAGPPGVGKSRLVATAVAGLKTVRAMASPVSPAPFGLAGDLLSAAGSPGPAVGGDGVHPVRAVVAALRALPHDVIIAEDLHWADADSLAVLVDLARAPGGPLLAATTREEPGRPLVAAMSALAGTPDVTTLTLSGLSTGGVATMLEALCGAPVPARTAVQVRRRTDGLPFWVEELARSAADPADLATAPLPDLLNASLRDRVDAAGPAARRLAEVAAVLGEQVRLAMVAGVLGQPEESLLATARALTDAWVLTERQPGQLAFRHALTREAVAARVPQAQRRQWHTRAYGWLREAGASDPELAWYAAGAGLSVETVAAARRGANSLLRAGSGAEALRLAELALEAGAEPAWPVHAVAARAAYLAGWFDEAGTHADAWRFGAAAAGDVAELADAECLRANLCWHAGDLAGQQAALASALSRSDLPAAARARVLAARANSLLRAEMPSETVVEADRALAAAEAAGDPTARRSAMVDKAAALCSLAGPERPQLRAEGLALLEQAERECEAAGDRVTLGRVLNNGLAPRMAGLPAAQQWAVWDAAWQRTTSLGIHTSKGKIARQAVDLAYTTGQWQRGWDVVNARLAEESEPVERVVLAAKAALLALEAGRIDHAARLAERSNAEVTGMDQFWAVLYTALVDVALTACTGPPARTVRALSRYRAAVALRDHPRKPHRAIEAAWWALAGGVAPAAVQGFLASTLPDGPPPWLATGTELMLAEAAGDPARAVRIGESLLDTDRGAVYRADALTRWGRALLAVGRREEADACADEACALLAGWRGRRLQAAQTLRQAVVRAGPALTPREQEIRELVAAGLSNRAIATRLGISARTVAVHLSRLLAKTGSASRTELAVRHLRDAGD